MIASYWMPRLAARLTFFVQQKGEGGINMQLGGFLEYDKARMVPSVFQFLLGKTLV